MKPSLSELLGGGAMTMATGVLPLLEAHPYGRGNATIVMMLLMLAAEEAEKQADVLAAENARLRGVFARAADAPLPEDLGAAVRAAAAGRDDSLRVSALQAENARLRGVLVALHTATEATDAPWGVALDAEIWSLLRDGAAARLVQLPPM
ncbi:MAG: hypothetical protein KJS97_11505 [Alphaproteobacteria bacterium]|nr:hypothetical protein [Alphaproteobacteria bacterium]